MLQQLDHGDVRSFAHVADGGSVGKSMVEIRAWQPSMRYLRRQVTRDVAGTWTREARESVVRSSAALRSPE